MTGVYYTNSISLTNSVLVVGISYYYYCSYLKTINIISNKNLLLLNNKKILFYSTIPIYCLIVQAISFITLKGSYTIANLTSYSHIYRYIMVIFIVTIILLSFFSKLSDNIRVVNILTVLLVAVLNSVFFIYDLLTFLLFLEVLTTIYYFFFLTTLDDNQTIIKLKNLLISYIWLSFLMLVFYTFSLVFLVKTLGTVNFYEINLFEGFYINKLIFILIFIAMCWKLGIGSFQFFKLELYQYLDIYALFIFSVFSIISNSYFLFFILLNFLNFFFFFKLELLILILIVNILIVLQGLNTMQFFQFLAISSLNTLTTGTLFILL